MTEDRVYELVGQMHDRILEAQGPNTRRWVQMPKSQQKDWVDASRWLVAEIAAARRREKQEGGDA